MPMAGGALVVFEKQNDLVKDQDYMRFRLRKTIS